MGVKGSHHLVRNGDGELYIPRGKIITLKEVQYMKFQTLQKKCDFHEIHSPDSFLLARAYNDLGELFIAEGYIEAALEELLKSLVILAQIEPESSLIATVQFNVSKVYIFQRLYTHALKQLTKSLEIRLKLCPKSVAVAQVYIALEYVSDKLGLHDKSEAYRQLASEVDNALYEEATEEGTSRSEEQVILAQYYQECGQHLVREFNILRDSNVSSSSIAAKNLLFDAILKFETALTLIMTRDDLKSLQASLNCDLGVANVLQGSYSEAVTNYHSALTLYELISTNSPSSSKTGGADSDHTVVMVKIAEVHKLIGDTVQFLKDYEVRAKNATAAVTAAATVFNIETVVNPIKLARAKENSDQSGSSKTSGSSQSLTVALQHYKQSEQILDIFHPSSLMAATLYSAISSIHYKQRQYPLSAEYLQRTLTILNKETPDSTAVAEAHNALGQTLFDGDNSKEALLHFQMASELFERLRPDSALVAETYISIGLVYKDQGYPSTALVEFQKALAIFSALSGGDEINADVRRVQGLIESLAKRPHVMVSYL